MWLDTQDARSRDRNPSNFTLDSDSDHSSTKRTTLAKRILRYFYFWNSSSSSSSSSLCLHFFNTLSATRVLNSFEELRITLAAAGNSFARVLNPHGGVYIYIYIYIYMCVCVCVCVCVCEIHGRLDFLRLHWFPRGWVVESWIGVSVSQVSIPASGI